MAEKLSNNLIKVIARLPFVTLGIIAMNVITTILTGRDMNTYVLSYGLIPDPEHFRPGTLLTASFMHDGYVHLSMNMIVLYIFGREVEGAMGKLEYVLFYIGACFASSILHVAIVYATMPDYSYYGSRAMIRASGAVAGVMGVYVVTLPPQGVPIRGDGYAGCAVDNVLACPPNRTRRSGAYRDAIFGLSLKQVGYWSHLGGFVFGIVVALMANMALSGEREYLTAQAQRHYDGGNLLEAIRNHETFLKDDPENAYAHAEIGRLWAILEEEESLHYYQVAVELYISQGKEREALMAAQEMKRFWPKSALSPATRFRLASFLEEDGKPEEALEAFVWIIHDTPDAPEAQMALLKIGQIQLVSLNDRPSAIATLRGFLEHYPSSGWRVFVQDILARAQEPCAAEETLT